MSFLTLAAFKMRKLANTTNNDENFVMFKYIDEQFRELPFLKSCFAHFNNVLTHLWNGLIVFKYPKCCVFNFVNLTRQKILPGSYMALNFPGYRFLNPKPGYIKCFSCLTKQVRDLQDKEATIAIFGEL